MIYDKKENDKIQLAKIKSNFMNISHEISTISCGKYILIEKNRVKSIRAHNRKLF